MGGMGGVKSKGPPAFIPACCKDLMRECMYITAAERRREG